MWANTRAVNGASIPSSTTGVDGILMLGTSAVATLKDGHEPSGPMSPLPNVSRFCYATRMVTARSPATAPIACQNAPR